MTEEVDTGRRHFLTVATVAAGAVGAAFVAVPFLASWKPSARAKAMGAPVELDIGKLEPGAMVKVEWRGKAIFVVHRTPDMLAKLPAMGSSLRDPDSNESEQPEFAKNEARALKPEYLVLVGVCTHLGCAPLEKFTPGDVTVAADWQGGFFCPCHGSKFDLSGRVFKDVPAPTNLPVPPYQFVSDTRILIGADKGNA
ncbi:MAG: ubiquinol-cytochrome c reductase iron-sulfur subunit [Lysobacterales bacterium]|jgi:ubiquinol-cytochrome c reductase iron-sulfur subunit|nr:MAG: ubiquinol-cytochrome c reductase iron-sulfur subunit [Xanthomonadales bacterium]